MKSKEKRKKEPVERTPAEPNDRGPARLAQRWTIARRQFRIKEEKRFQTRHRESD
jgi:hypothetical protein